MLANQQSYERGLEDLKLTIDATVEKYKRKLTEKISLERLITECDLRNSDNIIVNSCFCFYNLFVV